MTKYKKTVWIDSSTPVNAKNLNNIEDAIERLDRYALTAGDFKTIAGKSIVGKGNISLGDIGNIPTDQEIAKSLGYVPANAERFAWEIWNDAGELEEFAVPDQIGSGLLRDHSEYAIGRYNISVPGNILTVGSGTGPADRKNSIEVKADGSVLIAGYGGYDGRNGESGDVKPIGGVPSAGNTGLKVWTGTREEYTRITDPDPGTVYFIRKG